MKYLPLLLAILLPYSAFALQPTYPSKGDSRIRYVNYSPDNVVNVITQLGRQTFIKFAEDERIEDVGGGDTEAWNVGVSKRENSFFIKPKAQSPNTNLTVVTNKHHYNFELVMTDAKNTKPMYMIWFRYPDEINKINTQQEANQNTEQQLNSKGRFINSNYWVEGAESLTPYAAWDDGQFTYFQFSARTDLPAIYVINEDGTESLVNTHVENDVVVVQRVVKKLVFRKGDLFTCIFNESYDPRGSLNVTHTISKTVTRKLHGGNA